MLSPEHLEGIFFRSGWNVHLQLIVKVTRTTHPFNTSGNIEGNIFNFGQSRHVDQRIHLFFVVRVSNVFLSLLVIMQEFIVTHWLYINKSIFRISDCRQERPDLVRCNPPQTLPVVGLALELNLRRSPKEFRQIWMQTAASCTCWSISSVVKIPSYDSLPPCPPKKLQNLQTQEFYFGRLYIKDQLCILQRGKT